MSSENGIVIDEMGMVVQNESGMDTNEVMRALRNDPAAMRMVAQFTQWSNDTRGEGGSTFNPYGRSSQKRAGGLFERDRYVTPTGLYDQMRLAYDAVDSDDVVSSIADSTESLAINKVSFYAEDRDEEDIYNQIAADLDLDSRLREMWKELFTVSQFYCAVWWTNKTYKVRGTTDKGNAKRKSYNVRVPQAISMLDPLKIVPVGNLMFNQEALAWCATKEEAVAFSNMETADPITSRLIMGRYNPTEDEKRWIANEGLDPSNLFLLNPSTVFRHTLTRPQFRRLSPVRMKPVFELLDMKHQLRSMDRAHLIGGTNFIILITKGSDELPGKPEEIQNLQENMRTIARLPVLVGDHRLSVEIITPKLDQTLKSERYSTLDTRITARLYGMFLLNEKGAGAGTDDSGGLVKVIARGLEGRRHMIQRSLERNIFGPLFTKNDALLTAPKMRYQPSRIDLSFDPNFANFLLELRQSNELSRDTLLTQFDLDQEEEARMLEREADEYDDIFQTQVPFSTPNPKNTTDPNAPATTPTTTAPATRQQQKRSGRNGGGTRNGGGAAPGTGQGQPSVRRRKSD